jgi:excisionase family DNA binding protein
MSAHDAPDDRRRGQTHRSIQFFTIDAVAELLDVASRTVRRWIANGDLVAHRIGNVVRIAEEDLQAFLAATRDR